MRLRSLLRRPVIRALAASLVLTAAAVEANAVALDGQENARPSSRVEQSEDRGERLEFAQGGCSAAAAQAAAETGGQVLSVQVVDRGGQTMCVVTVLVPGRDGSRPRRQTITVPQ